MELWCYNKSGIEDLRERRECLINNHGTVYFHGEQENGSPYYPHTQKSVPNGLKVEMLMAHFLEEKYKNIFPTCVWGRIS